MGRRHRKAPTPIQLRLREVEAERVGPQNGNQPRFNTISGNLIHHLGLYTKQACAVFSAVACQNLIEENVFFHGPRALFNM